MLETFSFLLRVRMASPTLSWTSRPPPWIEAPFNSGLLISGRNGTFPWHSGLSGVYNYQHSGLSGVHNYQHRGLSGCHNNISDLSVRQKDSESLLLCLFFCLFVCSVVLITLVSLGQNCSSMMQPVVSRPVSSAITVCSCLAGGFVRALIQYTYIIYYYNISYMYYM